MADASRLSGATGADAGARTSPSETAGRTRSLTCSRGSALRLRTSRPRQNRPCTSYAQPSHKRLQTSVQEGARHVCTRPLANRQQLSDARTHTRALAIAWWCSAALQCSRRKSSPGRWWTLLTARDYAAGEYDAALAALKMASRTDLCTATSSARSRSTLSGYSGTARVSEVPQASVRWWARRAVSIQAEQHLSA